MDLYTDKGCLANFIHTIARLQRGEPFFDWIITKDEVLMVSVKKGVEVYTERSKMVSTLYEYVCGCNSVKIGKCDIYFSVTSKGLLTEISLGQHLCLKREEPDSVYSFGPLRVQGSFVDIQCWNKVPAGVSEVSKGADVLLSKASQQASCDVSYQLWPKILKRLKSLRTNKYKRRKVVHMEVDENNRIKYLIIVKQACFLSAYDMITQTKLPPSKALMFFTQGRSRNTYNFIQFKNVRRPFFVSKIQFKDYDLRPAGSTPYCILSNKDGTKHYIMTPC